MTMNPTPLIPDDDEQIAIPESGQSSKDPQKLLFFLLGNSSLLAYNVIINAIDIYKEATQRESISTDLNRAYNIPCSLMAFLLCLFEISNYKISLISGLISLIVIMCLLPIFLLVSISEDAMYWSTIITICAIGVLSSLVFSSSNSFASQFGSDATAAVSSGNGCCGVIAASLRIITKACVKEGSKSEKYVNAAYFFISALIFLGTLIYLLYKLRDYNIAVRAVSHKKEEKTSVFSRNTLNVIGIIYPQCLSIFFNFCITLSIFPGYLTCVQSPSYLGTWTPVIITSLFCVFDWVGRAIPGKFVWPQRKYAWIPVAVRLVYYLIFMISIQKVVNLGDPWWTFFWMIPFGISNGMSGTVQIIYGANHDELTFAQRKTAGLLVSFAVNAGILMAMILTMAIPTPPN